MPAMPVYTKISPLAITLSGAYVTIQGKYIEYLHGPSVYIGVNEYILWTRIAYMPNIVSFFIGIF